MVKWLKLKIQVSVSTTQKSFFFKGKEIDTDRALWDRVQDDAKRKQQRQNEVLHCYLKKWIIEQFVERVNHRRSAWIVTVISLVVIIIHSNRWVHAFHSKRPKAFSLSLLNVLIFTALINAHSNYSLIEITVSYFIRNPLFESFQMGVHRLVSWCCLMRGGAFACWQDTLSSHWIHLQRMTRGLWRIKWWITLVQLISDAINVVFIHLSLHWIYLSSAICSENFYVTFFLLRFFFWALLAIVLLVQYKNTEQSIQTRLRVYSQASSSMTPCWFELNAAFPERKKMYRLIKNNPSQSLRMIQ